MAAKNDSILLSTMLQTGTLVLTVVPKAYGQAWPKGK